MELGELFANSKGLHDSWSTSFILLHKQHENFFFNCIEARTMSLLSNSLEVLYLNFCLLKIETKCLVL